MRRTQIYLDEVIYQYLLNESKLTKKTISELIRQNLETSIQLKNHHLAEHAQAFFGLWKDRDIDPSSYVRDLRKDRTI